MKKYNCGEYSRMHRKLHTPEIADILKKAVVGIAGLGGLGSNAAVSLARAGIGRLILVDFDKVEFSNLNRQYYCLTDIGELKTTALSSKITEINPCVKLELYAEVITPDNCMDFFGNADVVVEAVDDPDTKRVIIETVLTGNTEIPVVAASGIGGYGKNRQITERKIGRLTLIGDGESEIADGVPLLSPRVTAVAAMQANAVLELLLNKER